MPNYESKVHDITRNESFASWNRWPRKYCYTPAKTIFFTIYLAFHVEYQKLQLIKLDDIDITLYHLEETCKIS